MDKHRIDKFYTLVRLVLREVRESHWLHGFIVNQVFTTSDYEPTLNPLSLFSDFQLHGCSSLESRNCILV